MDLKQSPNEGKGGLEKKKTRLERKNVNVSSKPHYTLQQVGKLGQKIFFLTMHYLETSPSLSELTPIIFDM